MTTPLRRLVRFDHLAIVLAVAGAPAAARADAAKKRILFLPEDVESALLFADERAALHDGVRAVVADRFGERGAVVSAAEEREVDRLVAAGRVAAGGPVCRVAPSREHVVMARFWPYLGARTDAFCSGERCTLTVSLREPNVTDWWSFHDWYERGRVIADVPNDAAVAAWIEQLRASPAQPPAPPERPGILGAASGGFGSARDRTPSITCDDHTANWEPDADDFGETERRGMRACDPHGATWLGDNAIDVLLEVGPDGGVERCEAARQQDCLCGRMRRHRFQPGPPARRARMAVHFPDRQRAIGWGRIGVKRGRPLVIYKGIGSYPTIPDHADPLSKPTRRFSACLARRKRSNGTFRVAFQLDPSGRTIAAKVRAPQELLSPSESSCIERAARTALFSCPVDAEATVIGIYSLLVPR